jgi:hypothetical protein
MSSLKWLMISGCVAYLDQFKGWHWTRFFVLIGDGKNPLSNASPQKLYTLFNDTDETAENRLLQWLNSRSSKARPEKSRDAQKKD